MANRPQESYTLYNYEKLQPMSHDELMLPLVYWTGIPQHHITALAVHRSLRFGELMITGSRHGEFVIWKRAGDAEDDEEEDEEDEDENDNDNDDDNKSVDHEERIPDLERNGPRKLTSTHDYEWIATAMTLSVNTSRITSIVALTTYHEHLAFSALHADGELVICSVAGGGVLKICRSDRPIVFDQALSSIHGCMLHNDIVHGLLATNVYSNEIHFIDLRRGKQTLLMAGSQSSADLLMRESATVIDIAVFHSCVHATQMPQFVCIDSAGKMGIFGLQTTSSAASTASPYAFKVIHAMDFNSRLRNTPIAIGVACDDAYVVAASKNEFGVYCVQPMLSRIASKTDKHVRWQGMLVFDRFINYKMLPDFLHGNEDGTRVSMSHTNHFVVKRPFFVFLWQRNDRVITLFLVSKDMSSILTPIVQLAVPGNGKSEWNAVTHDDSCIYVGLQTGVILSYAIETVRQRSIDAYTTLWRSSFSMLDATPTIATVAPQISASIEYSFTAAAAQASQSRALATKFMSTSRSSSDDRDEDHKYNISSEAEDDDDHAMTAMEDDDDDDEHEMTCSCMNVTRAGVLLCIGYNTGMVYVYNVTLNEPALEFHTRDCAVNCLLLLSFRSQHKSHHHQSNSNDGVLCIGYSDGWIEIFNCESGKHVFRQQCHYGAVTRLVQFEQDYYVFSVGEDYAVCSLLVLSELLTMRGILEQIEDVDSSGRTDHMQSADVWCTFYRGHAAPIGNVYRTPWCLANDCVAVELETGDIVLWQVSTAQMVRWYNTPKDAMQFRVDQNLNALQSRRALIHSDIFHKLYNVYDIARTSAHLNVNILLLDVIAIFKNRESAEPAAAAYSVEEIVRVISLLLDWDLHSHEFGLQFIAHFEQYLRHANNTHGHGHGLRFDHGRDRDAYDHNLILTQDMRPCFGFLGDFESITMLFPICSRNGGKFKMHSKFTSMYMLGINTLCLWLRKQIQLHQNASKTTNPIQIAKHSDASQTTIMSDVSGMSSAPATPTRRLDYDTVLQFLNSSLMEFYSGVVPEHLSGFIEPSRSTISRCCLSSTSALRKTSRLLLEQMVQRMTPEHQTALITKWRDKLLANAASQASKSDDQKEQKKSSSSLTLYPSSMAVVAASNTMTPIISRTAYILDVDHDANNGRMPLSVLFNAILICVIHVQQSTQSRQQPNAAAAVSIEPLVQASVTKTLIRGLKETEQRVTKVSDIKKSLCCYYLGSVVRSWHVDTILFCELLQILLNLCTAGYSYDGSNKQKHKPKHASSSSNILSESAMWALIECGASAPVLFIKTIGSQALQLNIKRGRHTNALLAMQRLIYSEPLLLLQYIPYITKTILKCLDPGSPHRRKTLLQSTTSTLHALVHQYPHCSFHAATQRFAICCHETGQSHAYDVVIYDLRTATQHGKSLKHHKSPITALEFNADGRYLISYSATEDPLPMLVVWKINVNEGLLGFFGSISKCLHVIQLQPLTTQLPPLFHIQNTQIIWDVNYKNKIRLQREDQSISEHIVL